jgi:hypothetical protein
VGSFTIISFWVNTIPRCQYFPDWEERASICNGTIGGPDEERNNTCINRVYKSGRTSVMIWGAIGWDYKSPLGFLDKEEYIKGTCTTPT